MFCLAQLSTIIDAYQISLTSREEDILIKGFSTDTRFLEQGEVFIALRGETFDGHRFAEVAVAKGAVALIVEEVVCVKLPISIPQFIVKNTYQTYQKIAHWWRTKLSIPIIGITGSVGKTTTKELVAGVCATSGKVHKTEQNFNNEIGVPKTLLGIGGEHDYAVIEMGMRGAGEIALLTEIVSPTVGIITNVGTAHIGRLGSVEAIAKAKCELLTKMDAQSIAILNQDNPLLIETASQVWSGETITYGLEGGDLQGELIDDLKILVEGKEFLLPLPGRHNATNYLAAIAVAKVLGIDWSLLQKGISLDLPQGRAQRYLLPNNILLLDETYNAGLESMLAALDLLKETPGERYLAVLGAMKELGDYEVAFHQQVGQRAKMLAIDILFVLTSQPEAVAILEGAKGINTINCSSKEDLLIALQETIRPGDRLLFKASHSVGLTQVVESLKEELT